MSGASSAGTSNSGSSSNEGQTAMKLLLRRFALVLAAAGPLLLSLTVASASVRVDRVVMTGLASLGEQEMAEMLRIAPGSMLDEEMLRRGIKTAFLKGIFEEISVTVREGEQVVAEVKVRERDRIRKVRLTGAAQLPEKLIRGQFLFKEDELMGYDQVRQSLDLLKAWFSEKGYPAAEITLDVVRTDRPYAVDLDLRIEAGKPLLIRGITLNLAPASPEAAAERRRLLDELSAISPGDVFDHERLGRVLRHIRNSLKVRGHIKPVVGPYSFSDGILEIPVQPGRRLEIIIEGNKALGTKTLMKEISLTEMEDINDEVVGEAADRLLALYHTEGYPFVQVAPVMKADGEILKLSFFVYEGQRVRVGKIGFSGATLPAGTLKGVMLLAEGGPYNPDLLERDRESVRDLYGALGYLETVVKKIEVAMSEDKGSAGLTVQIEEGERTTIESVTITGSRPEVAEELARVSGLKTGDPYNEVDISDGRFRILDHYSRTGYSAADVAVQREILDRRARVVFQVTEGAKKYLGTTVITGNTRTRYKVIQRELLHKDGQPFDHAVFAEEKHKLYKLGLFTDVEIETADVEGDRSSVLVKVTEGNAGSVEFGAGYAEHDRLRGFVEVSYRNLGGMNREGLMRAEVSSLEQRYLLQYNEPWFLGRTFPLRVFFQYDKKREINASTKEILYRLTRYSLTAGIEKKLSSVMKSELYYEFALVRTADVKPDVVLTKEDSGTIAISSIKPALVYDTRDNPFEPEKGVLAGASLKFASFLLFSETNFAKLELYASRYQKLGRGLVLAVSLRGGVAYHFGDTQELPLVERFFLGGRSTVRGFDQDTLGPKGADGNPTGGNVFLMGNAELRVAIGKGFGLVPFVDIGNVWVNTKQMHLTDLRYTTGLGLRYNTPVGPLRADYGYKLNREPGESRGALHFSVGHAF
ncbi:MAG: outer membrane protein assembly factor BamA [Nitrospirae bacterium]|nr:MAG: outer membrane protein assembly factor BamA [Nitrospirota bacterium]